MFGQTETLGAYTTLGPDDHRNPIRSVRWARPLPGVELRVVDPGTGDAVAHRRSGRAVVLSDQNVQPGGSTPATWPGSTPTATSTRPARLSDTINRGGEKFGPIEVEAVLRDHPAIVEVSVVAVPDTEMGERVGALIVTSAPLTDDEVRTFCADRLARFKLPERIAFVERDPVQRHGKGRSTRRRRPSESIVSLT